MKKIELLFLTVFIVNILNAKITLPSLVSDNMVIQQNTEVCIWGWTDTKSKITLTTSWINEKYTTRPDSSGLWKIYIATPEADFIEHKIVVNDGTTFEINNVLLGEVWVGGGQSNMKMPLGGLWHSAIRNNNTEIMMAKQFPNIRMFTVDEEMSDTPKNDCNGQWQVNTSDNLQHWSAVGYFFAKNLNLAMDVPIGIINSSWGGTKIECWMSKEDLKKFEDVDYDPIIDQNRPRHECPYLMYNAMLYPLANYTIKGFIFYQGCSNVFSYSTYAAKMEQMVSRWRSDWNLGDLPFYYVQIAPFNYGENKNGALLREAQYEAQKIIPNSGMVAIYDLCVNDEPIDAHPLNKAGVGERLAFTALNRTYGYNGICSDYPVFESMEIKDQYAKIIVNEGYAEGIVPWKHLKGFEIAGEDGIYYPAKAEWSLGEKKILVNSENVTSPKNVRYCFDNVKIGNVKNLRGLPLIPFRTDK